MGVYGPSKQNSGIKAVIPHRTPEENLNQIGTPYTVTILCSVSKKSYTPYSETLPKKRP